MRITYLPHARERMERRSISEEDVRAALESPDFEYPGRLGRTVAELSPGAWGRFDALALRVIYNLGAADLAIAAATHIRYASGGNRPTDATTSRSITKP